MPMKGWSVCLPGAPGGDVSAGRTEQLVGRSPSPSLPFPGRQRAAPLVLEPELRQPERTATGRPILAGRLRTLDIWPRDANPSPTECRHLTRPAGCGQDLGGRDTLLCFSSPEAASRCPGKREVNISSVVVVVCLLGALLASHPQGPPRWQWILRIKSCDLMETTTHRGWAIPETLACSQLSKESVGLSLRPPGPSHRGQHHQEI